MYDSTVRSLLAFLLILPAACAPTAVVERPRAMRSSGAHRFTNPLLDLETGGEFRELASLRGKISSLADSAVAAGDVSHVSIYFRDLNNGPWFGVNQSEYFSPASLFKVPFMMGILKQAEKDPGLLSRRLEVVLPADPAPLLVPPQRRVESGGIYTVAELLDLLIAHSDNVALEALYTLQLREVYSVVFQELGLPVPSESNPDLRIKVKDYASFFRILYNASYLSREMSEKALEMLARSSFSAGIPSGVPAGTTVAHKFGERVDSVTGEIQLHDCGIVYHPRTPYVVCVMTRGKRLDDLLKTIRSASALVHAEVDKH